MEDYTFYRKPAEICIDRSQWQHLHETELFIKTNKQEIERFFNDQGLKLVKGELNDIERLYRFTHDRWIIFGERIANDLSAYDIYRFILFGYALMLENKEGELLACVYSAYYQTPDKCTFNLRLAMDERLKGKNTGLHMVNYLNLIAMEKGMLTDRGLLETDNSVSAYLHLNKMGCVFDNYHPELQLGIQKAFMLSLRLTPVDFVYNRIDIEKLLRYIEHNQAGSDYQLIDFDDFQNIESLYKEGRYLIVAMIREGWLTDKNLYFALPKSQLEPINY